MSHSLHEPESPALPPSHRHHEEDESYHSNFLRQEEEDDIADRSEYSDFTRRKESTDTDAQFFGRKGNSNKVHPMPLRTEGDLRMLNKETHLRHNSESQPLQAITVLATERPTSADKTDLSDE